MTKTLLLGDNSLSDSTNTLILNSTVDYVIAKKSLMTPLVINYKKKIITWHLKKIVLVYFLKFSLYLYLTPFKFSLVKKFSNYLLILNFLLLNI